MRSTIRRMGSVAAASALAAAVVAGAGGSVAGAQGEAPATAKPETFIGGATGTALNANLLGQQLTLGFSKVDIASTLKAVADGAGQLVPQLLGSATKSEVSSNGQRQEKPQTCANPALPAEVSALLSIGAACSSSVSEVKDGAPYAKSEGSVASLGLSANTVLTQVVEPLQPLLEQVFGQLNQIAPQLDPVTATVGDLVETVANTQTLAVKLGASTSEAITKGDVVTSIGTAAGGQIDILPLGGLSESPLASIIVGSSKATSVYDRATGKSTASFDPAIVRVRLALPALGQVQEIPLAPGQNLKILEGTPLESEIIVGAGSQASNPDGSVKAIADGVSLKLLKGINGGVTLALAHAEAGVAGAPAVAAPPPAPAPAPPTPQAAPELPRTGGPVDGPWLPIAGVTLIAGALVTRRWVLSTRPAGTPQRPH